MLHLEIPDYISPLIGHVIIFNAQSLYHKVVFFIDEELYAAVWKELVLHDFILVFYTHSQNL